MRILPARAFRVNQALCPTYGFGRGQFQKPRRRLRQPGRHGIVFHHSLELAIVQAQSLGGPEDPMLPGRFRRRSQRVWDRKAGLVSTPPALQTAADPPHADRNLNRVSGSHNRSSSPLASIKTDVINYRLAESRSLPKPHLVPIWPSTRSWRRMQARRADQEESLPVA